LIHIEVALGVLVHARAARACPEDRHEPLHRLRL